MKIPMMYLRECPYGANRARRDVQCDIRVGTVIEARIYGVIPPSTNSRGREKAVGRIALAASEPAPLGCTAVLPRGTSHCRGRYFPAGGRLPRFPRFGLGSLPVKPTRGSLANCLRRPAPSSRPLDRAVDQNPDQQDWTYDLHDGEQGHGLNGVEHAFFSKRKDVWP
jgi:hypothetical protein